MREHTKLTIIRMLSVMEASLQPLIENAESHEEREIYQFEASQLIRRIVKLEPPVDKAS